MMSISPVLFWAVAALAVLSSLGVVMSRNIVHSALFLIVAFLAVAGVYGSLGVAYVAVAQVLVYGGAIAILLIFAIMLTRREEMEASNPFAGKIPLVGLAVAGLGAVMISALWQIGEILPPAVRADLTESIGISLFGAFVVPLEAAAVLLLVAMIGAVMLARGGKSQ